MAKLVIRYKGDEIYNFTCAVKGYKINKALGSEEVYNNIRGAYVMAIGYDAAMDEFFEVDALIRGGINFDDLSIEIVKR